MEEDIQAIAARVQDVRSAVADIGIGLGHMQRERGTSGAAGLGASVARYEADSASVGAAREDLLRLGSVGA
jgi:hypothetical protein